MLTAVIVSLASGVTNVLGRTFNARLARATNDFVATLANYLGGLLVSALVLAMLWNRLPSAKPGMPAWWVFIGGGALGVVVVTLLSLTAVRISSFYLTLLVFVGQVFAGVAVDILLDGRFSWQNLCGGLLVSVGMAYNLLLERKEAAQKPDEKNG